MNSLRFYEAEMKKCQVGSEEMQAEWCRKQHRRTVIFCYGIEKISQGLRKCRNGSKKFAFLAKILLYHIFAVIAKFRYHSENFCA